MAPPWLGRRVRRTRAVGWGLMVLASVTMFALVTVGGPAALAEPANDRIAAENALAQVAAAALSARDAGAEGSSPAPDGHTALATSGAADGGIAEGGLAEGGIAEGGIAEGGIAEGGSARLDANLARGPAAQARRALERARGARAAGDTRHAELLEGLAREWAETARDVLRVAEVEQQADALEVAAAAAVTRGQRARALLEVDVARRGRAEAELARLSSGGSRLPTSTDASAPRSGRPASGSASKGAP